MNQTQEIVNRIATRVETLQDLMEKINNDIKDLKKISCIPTAATREIAIFNEGAKALQEAIWIDVPDVRSPVPDTQDMLKNCAQTAIVCGDESLSFVIGTSDEGAYVKKYIMVKRTAVQFSATDDYATTGNMAAIIKSGRIMIGGDIPALYNSMWFPNIVAYQDVMKHILSKNGRQVPSGKAVVFHKNDLSGMATHALARYLMTPRKK